MYARPSAASLATRDEPMGPALAVLLTLWALVLFEPQWYLAARGPDIILNLPTVFYLGLAAVVTLGIPADRGWSRRWQWYVPFLCFIATGAIMIPFATNSGYARNQIQVFLQFWLVMVATATLLDSVRRAELLLSMYGLAFLWWSLWGGRDGLVFWHHSFNNYDAYGAFMVGGLGMSFFLGMAAAPGGWFRRIMFATAAFCAVGIVASFARGAVLASFALFVVMWLRSPRKGVTLLAGIGGLIVIVAAATVIHPSGFFWNEIMSTFSEGTTAGTGGDRWELWKAGWKVFLERPIFGVGPRNFGPFATTFFDVGDVGSRYTYNPGTLYGRSLHSIWVAILCEFGIVGSAAFLWVLWDFWKRNAALRTPAAEQRWTAMGGRLRLHQVALGLEASMVGFMVTGAFYPMLNMHWFFTTLALNLTLHALAVRSAHDRPSSAAQKRRRSLAAAAPTSP